MADIDFTINEDDGFTVSLMTGFSPVRGNRALLNRFQIAFLTNSRSFLNVDGSVESDFFGGDAPKFLGVPVAVNNMSAIAAAILNAIDSTVSSMRASEQAELPNSERIGSASLSSIDISGDTVFAIIRVVPVETESYGDLVFNIPVRGV
jgi:hypothetical protein